MAIGIGIRTWIRRVALFGCAVLVCAMAGAAVSAAGAAGATWTPQTVRGGGVGAR
jgi:hypothetical protein